MLLTTRLLIIQLGFLLVCDTSAFIIGHASICHQCDDTVSGKECSTYKHEVICQGDHPYCFTTIIGAANMTVIKRCASDSQCQSLWWQRTKPNPSCSQSAIEHGSISPGVTCNFCCAASYSIGMHCNSDLYPYNLLKYKDLPTTPTTTPTPTTTTMTTTSTTQTSATTTQTPSYELKASMCLSCVDDPSRGITCNESSQFRTCHQTHPYCITTYVASNGSYVIHRGCATKSQCYSDWWMNTRLNSDCMQSDLLNRTSRDHLECHYCCRAPDIHHPFCNRHSNELLPQYLVSFYLKDGTTISTTQFTTSPSTPLSTLTSISTTTKTPSNRTDSTSASTTKTPPTTTDSTTLLPTTTTNYDHRCEVTGNDANGNTLSSVHQCDADSPYCLNTVIRHQHGNSTVKKRCASETECYSEWWQYTRTNPLCMSHNVTIGVHGVTCLYCCDSKATGSVCNLHDVPQHTVSFEGRQCEVTGNDVNGNAWSNVHQCDADSPYCLNTVIRHQHGNDTIRKRCASEAECYSEWWQYTRTNPLCMSHNVTIGVHGVTCLYCCDSGSTDTVCNLHNVPQHTMSFEGTTKIAINQVTAAVSTPTTTAATTPTNKTTPTTKSLKTTNPSRATTANTTTWVNLTASTPTHPPTTRTTSTTPTLITASKSAGAQCQVCEDDPSTGKTCSMSDVVTCPHEEPFCMNTYVVNINNTKRIIKSCASDGECYNDWWINTRHNDQCMNNTGAPSVGRHGLVCRFCCEAVLSNVCNIGLVPKSLLQYKRLTTANTTSPSTTSNMSPSTSITSTAVASTTALLKNTTTNVTAATNATKPGASDVTVTTSATTTTTTNITQAVTMIATSAGMTTPIKTAAQTNTTMSGTSNMTATATTTPTTHTTDNTTMQSAAMTTPTPQVECYVCQNGCPFLQSKQTCTSGYCMTTVIDDEHYTRTIQKRCVDRHECYTKWWQQTSDNDFCISLMSMGNVPSGVSIQCDYCCQGDECNKDAFPPQDTLFDASR